MRSGISIIVTASDRGRLEALVTARGSPQKHVWRARIILLTGDGLGTVAIMAATGKRYSNFLVNRGCYVIEFTFHIKGTPQFSGASSNPWSLIRSWTSLQPRSLLSIAKSKKARSRVRPSRFRWNRTDQTC